MADEDDSAHLQTVEYRVSDGRAGGFAGGSFDGGERLFPGSGDELVDVVAGDSGRVGLFWIPDMVVPTIIEGIGTGGT